MALVVKDRIRETTTTTGSGTITLAGAVTTFDAFSEIGDGNTTYYAIVSRDANEWEVGLGTYTLTGTTLARTTVLASSNSGSAVVFSAGTKDVICTYPAGKSVYADASDVVNMGTTVISGSSSSDMLRITQTGAGNALVVEDSTNPDSTPFVVTSGGSVVVGYTTRDESISSLEVHSPAAISGAASVGAFNWQAGTTGSPSFSLYKSESGTVGTHGIASSGATSSMLFKFDDGTNFIRAASISAAVDGTPGTNDMPGRLSFSTTADGASSPTERMRINSAGVVTAAQDFVSGVTDATAIISQLSGNSGRVATYNSSGGRIGVWGNGGRWWYINGEASNTLTFGARTSSNTVDSDYIHLTTGGQLGIGVTPSAHLTVNSGTSDLSAYFASTDTIQYIAMSDSSGSTAIQSRDSGAIAFRTGGDADTAGTNATEAMRIDSAGRVGIGVTPVSYQKLAVSGTYPAGSNIAEAVSIRGTIPSGATSSYDSVISRVDTEAAAFNLGTLRHFYVNPGTFGAGSTVTNQYGFFVNAAMTGATNNYGFYGNIASGTGRYNFYANGTADNYFAGNVGIGSTNPTQKLVVVDGIITNSSSTTDTRIAFVQSGTGSTGWIGIPSWNTDALFIYGPTASSSEAAASYTNAIWQFYTGAVERMRIDSAGLVGIGRTPTTNLLEVAGTIESTSGGFKFPDGSTQTKSAGHGLSAMMALGVV